MSETKKKIDVKKILRQTEKAEKRKAAMEAILKKMTPDCREEAKRYISQKEIPQLFESITAGMLHHRPEHPVQFVQECLEEVEKAGRQVRWNSFIDFQPSEAALGSRPSSSAVNELVKESEQPSAQSTSVSASFRPAPITAHPDANRPRAQEAIQAFP